MDRRQFIGTIAAGLIPAPFVAEGQPLGRVYRIGWLTPVVRDADLRAFRDAMRALGYVEGQTVRFEARSADNDLDRLPRLAAELVQSKVDVIVAAAPPAILAARQTTDTIPIVMAYWGGSGLIESGVVASFSRPGGNVTGVYMLAAELDAKRVEFLLEAVPKARKLGVLVDAEGAAFTPADARRLSDTVGIQVHVTEVGTGHEGYERAFTSLAEAHVDALLVPAFPRFDIEAYEIIELAARRRVPAVYEFPSMSDKGGLMAYGPILAALNQRVADFVDRILKGAKPGNLPVEQPTKFELVINLNTAKTIGLTIPQPLMLRADRSIQ